MRRLPSLTGIQFKSRLRQLAELSPEQFLTGLLLLSSAAFSLSFAWVALSRIRYPYDLEWMEGGMLSHSFRLLHGQPLYAQPSADFIAYIYQPFYPILVALVGAVVGLTPTVARGVSLAATVVLSFFLARSVWLETHNRRVALIVTGLFFALYPVTGFWFDLARVDSLFLLLVMAGLYIARYHAERRGGWLASSLCLVAAYFTKQTALLFIPLAFFPLYRTRRRFGLGYLILSATLTGLLTQFADLRSDRWYTYYTHHLLSGEPYLWDRIHHRLWVKIAGDLPIVLAAATGFSIWRIAGRPVRDVLQDTWILATLISLVAAVATWCRPGGYDNNFLPLYVFALIPFSQALEPALSRVRPGVALSAGLLVAIQFFVLAYDPRDQVPSQVDLDTGRELVGFLAAEPGPVLIPEHPWYAVLAGKALSYQSMALLDLQFKEGNRSWPEDLLQRLRRQEYTAIVTTWEAGVSSPGSYPDELKTLYHQMPQPPVPGSGLDSITGTPARPTYLYRPVAATWTDLELTRDFEQGNYRGWFTSGTAFGEVPATGAFPGQQPVSGYGGRGLVNSFIQASDHPTGTLTTRWFRMTSSYIRFKVGGGANPDEVGVQLWTDRGPVRRAAGRDSEQLEQVEWDVRRLQGQLVQLRVIDAASGAWGHVLFDDLELVD